MRRDLSLLFAWLGLLLGSACATPAPKTLHQAVLPLPPLVEPIPIVAPGPIGLTPPVTVIVDPRAQIQNEPEASRSPEGSGSPRGPAVPLTSERRRPECEPMPVPHRGGDAPHNECADRVPPNRYPGHDVLVNGKHFDALQVGVHVLWEIKTDRFDTYNDFVQEQTIRNQVELLREERDIAEACGYGFVVGVSSSAHKAALEREDLGIEIVVTECQR